MRDGGSTVSVVGTQSCGSTMVPCRPTVRRRKRVDKNGRGTSCLGELYLYMNNNFMIIIIIYFENVYFFHAQQLGLDVYPDMKSFQISLTLPIQTVNKVVSCHHLHTLQVFRPLPTHLSKIHIALHIIEQTVHWNKTYVLDSNKGVS